MLKGYLQKCIAALLIITVSYTQLLHIFHTFLHDHRQALHRETGCGIHDNTHTGHMTDTSLPGFRLQPYEEPCPLCDDLYHQHIVQFLGGDPMELQRYFPEAVTLGYQGKGFVEGTSVSVLFNKGPPPFAIPAGLSLAGRT